MRIRQVLPSTNEMNDRRLLHNKRGVTSSHHGGSWKASALKPSAGRQSHRGSTDVDLWRVAIVQVCKDK